MDIIANNKLLDLTERTAIVTGGAIGIGYGITDRLAKAGAKVMIAGRNEQEMKDAVVKQSEDGRTIEYFKADISRESEVKALIDETVRRLGTVDILVNNAGVFPVNPLATMTVNDFEQVISINLTGVFLTTKYVSEVMKKKRAGKIINITSIDAIHPSMIGLAHYDASKHGVWGFTKNTALELASYGITVNSVAPGGVATPGVAKMSGGQPVNDDATKAFLATIPMKRMGEADEIGKVVLFLASDMSSYMTGTQIVVDGGALIA